MKLCIFSDIHGNSLSLNKMLENEIDSDLFVFMGDIFGYFTQQKYVFDSLFSIKNLVYILGNHDANYLDAIENTALITKLIYKYGSSYKYKCNFKELEFINKGISFYESEIDGLKLVFYHGGFNDYLNDRIYPDTEIKNFNAMIKYDYVFLGHTHYQMQRKCGSSILINPGSLGQPRDSKGFSYCIFDTKTKEVEFKTVSINVYDLIDELDKNNDDIMNHKYLIDKYRKGII